MNLSDLIKNPKVMAAAALVLLLLTAGLFLTVLRGGPPEGSPQEAPRAEAPAAGTTPARGGLAAADRNGDGIVYQSGMHPWIVEDAPGQCPICGMDLMPVNVNDTEEGTVRIDPVTRQNIGVRTAPVTVEPLQRTVRTTGRFEANEQATAVVAPKIGGWVEKLHVNYEGARVEKGQPLLEVYSPELVATQEEYLLALRNAERLSQSQSAKDGRRLTEAARRRLAYWDVSEEQIRRLEEAGVPQKTLTLYAPAAGTVTATDVTQGQQIQAGQALLHLADLSRLWLMIDVYEQDLAWVDVGTRAKITLPYAPGRTLEGEVDYIYDQLDPEARTLRARVTLDNPDRTLKPGMYATVELVGGGETEPRPVVPEEALIRTGEREVVILALGDGRFRPAEVTSGLQADGRVQILDGLQGNERVVTSAQFLIDSEARLASAVGAMMDQGSDEGPGPRAESGGRGTDQGVVAQGMAAQSPAKEASMKATRIDVRALDADGDGFVFQCETTPHGLADAAAAVDDCPGPPVRVSIGTAQAVLTLEGYTNVPVDPAASDANGDGVVYQSPMHWSVLKDEDGRCDVCGMFLEEVTIAEARENLQREGYVVREE